MGTWNRRLFSNDTACDVRDTYIELLKKQYSDEEAYQKTYEEYKELLGGDEEAIFWYAIADAQWKTGRLTSEVKEKANYWIIRKGGIDLWDDRNSKKWDFTLRELKNELDLPMPPKKMYKKPVEFITNPWSVGDVYAYQFHTKISEEVGLYGKYILFEKIGNCEYYKDKYYSVVKIYNRIFDNIPDLNVTNYCSALPLTFPPNVNGAPVRLEDYIPSFEWYLQAVMLYEKKSCYPKSHFIFLGKKDLEPIVFEGNQLTDFYLEKDNMEKWLIEIFLSWKHTGTGPLC